MTDASTTHPPSGQYAPRPLTTLFYGPGVVQQHLLSLLPSPSSRALIVTGSSLATKTPLISGLESLLGKQHHAATFSKISQHAPVAQLDEATALLISQSSAEAPVDTVISVGGGSPIDSSKALSYRLNQQHGRFLRHISIPTTLSAAECTPFAGYTKEDGTKTGVGAPECAIAYILYDPAYAKYTPKKLLLGTGMRAMDHAIETLYNPKSSEVPAKSSALFAAGQLFKLLPQAAERVEAGKDGNEELLTHLLLAAYASLGMLGVSVGSGLGLSHSMGYALGSPYGIPHGETSCLTLGKVVKLKARGSKEDAEQAARALVWIGGTPSGDVVKDAEEVGDRIEDLVKRLGMHESLTSRGIGRDQVDIITQRATGGQKSGELYDAVKKLTESLY